VQVKDVLFEPVRKTQDAMFFFGTAEGDGDGGAWTPCGPTRPGAVQITMQELAAKGLAAQVSPGCPSHSPNARMPSLWHIASLQPIDFSRNLNFTI
jgi:hypothetical protein